MPKNKVSNPLYEEARDKFKELELKESQWEMFWVGFVNGSNYKFNF